MQMVDVYLKDEVGNRQYTRKRHLSENQNVEREQR